MLKIIPLEKKKKRNIELIKKLRQVLQNGTLQNNAIIKRFSCSKVCDINISKLMIY